MKSPHLIRSAAVTCLSKSRSAKGLAYKTRASRSKTTMPTGEASRMIFSSPSVVSIIRSPSCSGITDLCDERAGGLPQGPQISLSSAQIRLSKYLRRQTSLLCPAFAKPNQAQDILGNETADGAGAVCSDLYGFVICFAGCSPSIPPFATSSYSVLPTGGPPFGLVVVYRRSTSALSIR